jgi:hypothetical protein
MDSTEREQLIKSLKGPVNVVFENNPVSLGVLNEDRDMAEVMLEREWGINNMRQLWSNWLLTVIIFIVVFDAVFVLMLGFEWVKFTNENLVVYFLLESLVKIGGLAYIVVNFLFDRNSNKKNMC